MSITHSLLDGHERLYFAYGSNLHLAQMAQRCPASLFLGMAILHGYRWQINERGVANVKESDGDYVEGLVFSINQKEEKLLDRNEGVSKGFYDKDEKKVELMRTGKKDYYRWRTIDVSRVLRGEIIADEVQPASHTAGDVSHIDHLQDPADALPGQAIKSLQDLDVPRDEKDLTRPQGSPEDLLALVYLSRTYSEDGPIREEYIVRMEHAISDAVQLGVSEDFVDKTMRPVIHGPVKRVEKGKRPRATKTTKKVRQEEAVRDLREEQNMLRRRRGDEGDTSSTDRSRHSNSDENDNASLGRESLKTKSSPQEGQESSDKQHQTCKNRRLRRRRPKAVCQRPRSGEHLDCSPSPKRRPGSKRADEPESHEEPASGGSLFFWISALFRS